MVMTVVVLAVAMPSLTVQTMLYVPASVNPGVPVILAVRGDTPGACDVKVKSAGFPDCVIVRMSAASGSVAVAVIVASAVPRSEERRVGKESRARWLPYH